MNVDLTTAEIRQILDLVGQRQAALRLDLDRIRLTAGTSVPAALAREMRINVAVLDKLGHIIH